MKSFSLLSYPQPQDIFELTWEHYLLIKNKKILEMKELLMAPGKNYQAIKIVPVYDKKTSQLKPPPNAILVALFSILKEILTPIKGVIFSPHSLNVSALNFLKKNLEINRLDLTDNFSGESINELLLEVVQLENLRYLSFSFHSANVSLLYRVFSLTLLDLSFPSLAVEQFTPAIDNISAIIPIRKITINTNEGTLLGVGLLHTILKLLAGDCLEEINCVARKKELPAKQLIVKDYTQVIEEFYQNVKDRYALLKIDFDMQDDILIQQNLLEIFFCDLKSYFLIYHQSKFQSVPFDNEKLLDFFIQSFSQRDISCKSHFSADDYLKMVGFEKKYSQDYPLILAKNIFYLEELKKNIHLLLLERRTAIRENKFSKNSDKKLGNEIFYYYKPYYNPVNLKSKSIITKKILPKNILEKLEKVNTMTENHQANKNSLLPFLSSFKQLNIQEEKNILITTGSVMEKNKKNADLPKKPKNS